MTERKIIIPKVTPQLHEAIQEGFCGEDEGRCEDLLCKDCMFGPSNLEYFARYLQLDELPGEITIKEDDNK